MSAFSRANFLKNLTNEISSADLRREGKKAQANLDSSDLDNSIIGSRWILIVWKKVLWRSNWVLIINCSAMHKINKTATPPKSLAQSGSHLSGLANFKADYLCTSQKFINFLITTSDRTMSLCQLPSWKNK